ncbi:MAG: zf-HC2 domain-containing protein, partial [Candidatus Eisenbacteria bacterium]
MTERNDLSAHHPADPSPESKHLTAEAGGLLMRWLDGEVSAPERVRVSAHLATCPACGREVRAYRALFRGVSRLPARRPPAGLAARITAAALADRRLRRRFRMLEVAGSAYAASAVAVVIALGLSPWRGDLLAGGRTVLGAAVAGTVNAFVTAFDRLMWVFDGAVRLRESVHAVSQTLAPLGRSLELLAAQPELRAGLSVALVLTT